MKKTIISIIAFVIVSSFLLPLSVYSFDDVKGDAWYAEAVDSISKSGLMIGVSDSLFDPSGKVNCAQLSTILYRMAPADKISEYQNSAKPNLLMCDTKAFSSFPYDPTTIIGDSSSWYHDYMVWAWESGINSYISVTNYVHVDKLYIDNEGVLHFFTHGKVIYPGATRSQFNEDYSKMAGEEDAYVLAISAFPKRILSRMDVIAMFYKFAEYSGYDMSGDCDKTFTDFDMNSDSYECKDFDANKENEKKDFISLYSYDTSCSEMVKWAISHNIVEGFDDGTLKGELPVTRAQLATILTRFIAEFN